MFNYYFDTNDYTEILQYLSLFLLFVIGTMIYYLSTSTDKMNKDIKDEINNLDLECPECPEHPNIPSCPKCPKCPDLNCSNEGKCPECPENPECPTCPEVSVDCPNVEDIVSGIFPGRNPGVTSGGKYFDIMANDSYELMPDYDYYEPVDAFPSDSILSAPDSLLKGNVDVIPTKIDNSDSNNLVNTSPEFSLSRMNMADQGIPTGPSTFGLDSTRVEGGLSNVERQRRAAEEDGGNVDEAVAQQEARDIAEMNMRSDTSP